MTDEKVNAPLATGFLLQQVNEKITAIGFKLHDNTVSAIAVSNENYVTFASLILQHAQQYAAKFPPEEQKNVEITAAPLLVQMMGVAPHSDTQALVTMKLGNLQIPFLVDLAMLLEMCSNLQKITKVAPTKPKN